MDWLEALEERVGQAASRIKELGEENSRLAERVEELESSLAEAESKAEGADTWAGERDEIKKRVEGLAEGLERLLEE